MQAIDMWLNNLDITRWGVDKSIDWWEYWVQVWKWLNDWYNTDLSWYARAMVDASKKSKLLPDKYWVQEWKWLNDGYFTDKKWYDKAVTPIVNKTIWYSDSWNKVYVNSKWQNYYFDWAWRAQRYKWITSPQVSLDNIVWRAKNVKDLAEKFNDNPDDLLTLINLLNPTVWWWFSR